MARGVDSSDSSLDSADSAPDSAADSTDTGGGTVALVYTPDQTLNSGSGVTGFGCDVSSGGDIDGDGYDDVVVANDWSTGDGSLWVYRGSASGALMESQEHNMGASGALQYTGVISLVGDANGDGYDDVLAFGSWLPGASWGLQTAEAVWLVDASSNAPAGDVNGDGYDDAIFGSASITDSWDSGHVYIFVGGPDGMTEDASYIGDYDSYHDTGERFGWAVAGGMDLNGDGYSDVLGIGEADVRVFYGSSTGFPGGASADGQSLGECSRCDANNAGDVDGDGYDEVAVDRGSMEIYYGSASGVDVGAVDRREDAGQAFPASDLDRDGYDDLLLGTSAGIGLFRGGIGGASSTPLLNMTSDDPVYALAVGDLDSDGISDVIGGSPYGGVDPSCHGCLYVWLGSTITDPSRASTDTGADSGSDTHSGGEPDSGSDSAPDSDSAADSGAGDTAGARKTGCGAGGGCASTGGGVGLAQLAWVFVALVRRRSLRG